jgi:Ca2+-binding RTX toxin-like protein
MYGGAGNDTYYVDNSGDTVIEAAGEGTDSVRSSVTYMLGDNIENLTLTGTDVTNGTGNALDNALYGNAGANILLGEAGNDYLSADGGDDVLFGGAGNDTLIGGSGADTMYGGAGNDTFYVDNSGDTITEAAGEGTDSVRSSLTYTLGDNIENLTLTGTDAINGTGNVLDNALYGNAGSNVLSGEAGNDYLSADGGDDVLYGGAGNDTLIGGAGADTMYGGAGNDTFYVDNSGDTVIEAAGEGMDSVRSSLTYTLGDNIENLTLTGTDVTNGTGNALDNALYGNAGANILLGEAGNDYLSADGGDDVLFGGAGNDTLTGGAGNDTYMFHRTDGKDTVNETAGINGDTDIVKMTGGISETEPVIVKQNNDLYLFIDADNYMKVTNEFLQPNYGIERLMVSDGYYITRTDIENIVNTMSAINYDPGMDVIQKFNAMRVDQTYISTLSQSWRQP